MKKLLLALLTAAVVPVFSGCSNNNDIIWDIYPAGITIRIVDSEGNNLLSPQTEGNWMDEDFVVEYEGKAYSANWGHSQGNTETRYYMPAFRGLTVTRAWWNDTEDSKENYQLYFGEFDGAENAEIPIRFFVPDRDGYDSITLTHKIKWKRNTPKVTNSINVNGKVSEGTEAVIVLPKKESQKSE